MEPTEPSEAESIKQLGETDWAIRIGALQVALSEGIEDWSSRDGRYFYRATASFLPYLGIASYDSRHDVPATIPDPEYVSSTDEVLNPASWVIARSYKKEIEAIWANPINRRKNAPPTERKTLSKVTIFTIDEKLRKIHVVDTKGDMTILEKRDPPSSQDINDLCDALDDLQDFIKTLLLY